MSAEHRSDPIHARQILADTELFGPLGTEALDSVIAELEWLTLAGGKTLFRQDDDGDALYVVLGGRLRVEKRESGLTRVIREVGRGEIVGELSLLTGHRRSAGVRAVRDTELVRLPRDRFYRVLEEHPATAVQLTRILARWLVGSDGQTGEPGVATVAVVPFSEGAPVSQVARALSRALEAMGSTMHLDASGVDAMLWQGAARNRTDEEATRKLLHWLDEQERTHAFVVYEAESADSAWSSRCLRQADRVLNVAKAGARPKVGSELHQTMSGRWAAHEVVLIHEDMTAMPSGTSAWLVGGAKRHHHVRSGEIEDYARVGRLLTGRGVGVALSGGGARGFGHIGLLKAIQEVGIPVDQIGGTSMGAVIAAQLAAGRTIDEMIDLNRRGWTKYKPHKAYTLPYSSLVTQRQAERMLAMMFGDARIEDFWIDYFCVSTNLTQAEIMVHRNGPVVPAIVASIAIPGVAPPIVNTDGDLLVDGGVLNNLPAAELHRQAQGLVIASDASPSVELRADNSYTTTPSAWRALRDKLRPGRVERPFPTIFEVLGRSAIVASARETRRVSETADLYLQLPVDEYGIFAMEAIDEIVETAYAFARPRVEGWWRAKSTTAPDRRATRVGV